MVESLIKSGFALTDIANTLNFAPSSYYHYLNNTIKLKDEKIDIFIEIIKIYKKYNGIYGARKIKKMLEKQNIFLSFSTVARYMKSLGLKSIVKSKFPYKRNSLKPEEAKLMINLVKPYKLNNINQIWTTDITYIKTNYEGYIYLISFLDLYSRKVVSWGLFEKQTTKNILSVLKIGLNKRKPSPGIIIHSDKGAQFRTYDYRNFLEENHLIASYTSMNHSCDENANQESFHSLIKKEWLYFYTIENIEEGYRLIFDYIEGFYNPNRIHSSLNYASPDDFEMNNNV